ncbi:hypothetical protein Tco_0848965 [Tanacetum coccineum]
MIRRITFDAMELDGEACFGNIKGRNLDNSGMIHDESFRVDDLDLNLDLNVDLNVPLLEILLPKEVLEKEEVDVVNVDGFDSDEGCEDEATYVVHCKRSKGKSLLPFLVANKNLEAGKECTKAGVNPDIPVKGVQDQLQRNLEMHVSLSKAFRAKAKVERNVIGDHTL